MQDVIRKGKHQVAHYAQQTFRIVGLGWHSIFIISSSVELSCAFAGGHNSGVLSAGSSSMMIVVHMLISANVFDTNKNNIHVCLKSGVQQKRNERPLPGNLDTVDRASFYKKITNLSFKGQNYRNNDSMNMHV